MKGLDYAFLKDRYDFELDRKDQLTSSLALPVGVLSLLGGLVAVMIRTFTYDHLVLTWLFLLSTGGVVAAFAFCLVYLAKAYHRQTYSYLPLLAELRGAETDLVQFYETAAIEGDVAAHFQSNLEARIIEAADKNTINKDERSGSLHKARLALFVTLAVEALAGLFYLADQIKNQI